MTTYTGWKCLVCKGGDITGAKQTSKCRGTGNCYWCGRVPIVREKLAETARLELASP